MSTSVANWIAGRQPSTVMPLERWVAASVVEADGLVPALTGLARSALESALSLPGQQREGAFHLLAADALFTYACEAAIDTEDVEETLRGILDSASER